VWITIFLTMMLCGGETDYDLLDDDALWWRDGMEEKLNEELGGRRVRVFGPPFHLFRIIMETQLVVQHL